MTKTLLVGPAGCGKTHLLLDSFEKALKEAADPLASDTFFILPSMEHAERVISLLVQRGVKGFFHKRITTLSRLTADLFRVTDIPVASSLTRVMITRDLLKNNAWKYFSGVQDQPGFPGLLTQFVGELKESCISPEVFRERMNALKGFEAAYATKYEALAAFYEQYEDELKKRALRDPQDALRIFRARNPKGYRSPVKFKTLWIDGFFDFSNLQLEYLRELSKITEEMTVTLTQEEGSDRGEAFEAVARTRADLVKMDFEVRKMPSKSYRTGKPDLAFLQQNIFREKGPGICSFEKGAGPQNIVLMDAVGIDGEVELIAREIHRLHATGDYRYSDFAVLFRQIKNYGQVLGSIFKRYGIPAEIHERDRLKFSPWIATVVALLSIFRNGWQAGDLFAFLKSGYVRQCGKDLAKNDEWVAAFEQRAFQTGVSESREAWLAEWKGRAKEDPAVFNQEKAAVLKAFAELEDGFFTAKTVEGHIHFLKQAVYGTFGILEISDSPAGFVLRDAACVQRFEALLQEMRGYFLKNKRPEVSFESFADYFLGLVELDLYSVHERDKDRVQVYDVSLARQKEYRVVFVAGLLEKVFPLQVREDSLLSDWERKLMSAGLTHPLAERLPRQSIERLFFYLAVTRARERLYLSYPHLDIEGKESLPSFYLEEVRSLFGERITVMRQNLARPYPAPEEAITRREREVAVLGALRHAGAEDPAAGGRFEKFAAGVCGDAQSRERILAALKPIEAELLDTRIRDGGYFEVKEASPTRLELYGKCPYRYFAEKILKLQDPSGDISAMQKGSVLHEVLQHYFDPKRKKDPRETTEAFIRREIEAGLEKHPLARGEKYREDLDRRDLFETLVYFLEQEDRRLKAGSFRPAAVEYSFGSEPGTAGPALEIGDKERSLKLRGRADRIDTDKDKKFAVVTDYKTSARFKAGALELGTALQLPLYLLAVEKHLGLTPLGGEIYSIRDCKRSGFYCEDHAASFGKEFTGRSKLPEAEFRKILDRAAAFARTFAKKMVSLEIPVRPRDCEASCPYDTVCRIEKWRLPVILREIREDLKEGL